jgi:putative ABC transport system ATP-binding protein
MASSSPAIALNGVQFSYRAGKPILDIPSLEIERGERVFLFGPSGSGKTTLLGLLTGVLHAQKGSVQILGRDLSRMSGHQRDAFRGSHLGYIFQLFNLIPYLSVLENITLPCRLHSERRKRVKGSLEQEARHIASHLGIEKLLHENVVNLSVGQQQRVAAARSLMGAPEVIVADEPTSSLDFDHREKFIQLLFDCVREADATLLFVSHDRSLMPMFSRSLSLPEINKTHLAAA